MHKSAGCFLMLILSVIIMTVLKINNIEPFSIISWWWITCPIWIPIIIAVILSVIFPNQDDQ